MTEGEKLAVSRINLTIDDIDPKPFISKFTEYGTGPDGRDGFETTDEVFIKVLDGAFRVDGGIDWAGNKSTKCGYDFLREVEAGNRILTDGEREVILQAMLCDRTEQGQYADLSMLPDMQVCIEYFGPNATSEELRKSLSKIISGRTMSVGLDWETGLINYAEFWDNY